jgi:type II secretion system protein H
MGRRAKVAGGFTLLELIVTLAVLAIAAAVVAPALGRSTDTLRARAEVAGFAATLRHAREQAISQQRTHRVVVDAKARRVVIERVGESRERPLAKDQRGRGKDDDATEGEAKTEVSQAKALSPNLTIEAATTSEVLFDARGFASGGDFKVSSAGVAYRVTVDRLTGRVQSVRE